MNELCTRMGLCSFAEKEIVFLKEYCSVLKPLARGLDILQGEDNCFYGTLLPTLETIIKKIKALIPQLSTATVGLVYTIESSIKHRFAKVFESNNAIIAAITLPKFKLKWVDDQRKKDQFKQVLMQEIRLRVDDDVTETENPAQPEAQASSNAEKDHFYEFDSDEDSTSQNAIESEVNDYLSNAKQYECLNKYPKVKKLFLEYNTSISPSAPVERLFSLGGLVLTPKRNRLTDARFEKMLLMRYNKDFLAL